MASAVEFITAGIKIGYAVETTAGTRPPTGYVKLPGVKGSNALGAAPGTIETTTFDDLVYTRYTPDLIDIGGSWELSANMSGFLIDTWDKCITDFTTGIAKEPACQMWFAVEFPRMPDTFFLRGEPAVLALPDLALRSLVEATVAVTPTLIAGFIKTTGPIVTNALNHSGDIVPIASLTAKDIAAYRTDAINSGIPADEIDIPTMGKKDK